VFDGATKCSYVDLRTMPLFVTMHTICPSRVWSKIFKFLKEFPYKYKGIITRFKTMWKKQILARAIVIEKENWGNHAFVRDN